MTQFKDTVVEAPGFWNDCKYVGIAGHIKYDDDEINSIIDLAWQFFLDNGTHYPRNTFNLYNFVEDVAKEIRSLTIYYDLRIQNFSVVSKTAEVRYEIKFPQKIKSVKELREKLINYYITLFYFNDIGVIKWNFKEPSKLNFFDKLI